MRSLAGAVFALLLVLTATGAVGSVQADDRASARVIADLDYNSDQSPPAIANQNRLDLYLPPEPGRATGLKPVIVWVHGGGLMIGDKSNRMLDKARLFNDLGYIVASVNYRLSPDISDGDLSKAFGPSRIRAPDHIADVAEAIGWISRRIRSYGGDPDRLVLIGHSSGAQMVALAGTSPTWLRGRQVSPDQVLGVVSLDSDTWNVRAEADPVASSASPSRKALLWHTFGTPTEEAAHPLWDEMSPLLKADPSDPPFLFVTQSSRPARVASNNAVAAALGQDPATSVVAVPYDHEGINTALGAPGDVSEETARVSQFVQRAVASAKPAGVKITRGPPRRVIIKTRPKARKAGIHRPYRRVAFAFRGAGRAAGFQCRIDRRPFTACRSPRSFRLKPGSHTFRVRPLFPSGRPGTERKANFRIIVR